MNFRYFTYSFEPLFSLFKCRLGKSSFAASEIQEVVHGFTANTLKLRSIRDALVYSLHVPKLLLMSSFGYLVSFSAICDHC